MKVSYEARMLKQFRMPPQRKVEQALLRALFGHNGTIKEFGAGEKIVDDLGEEFGLSIVQRTASLQTIYRKENRTKKSLLWHRLLFRAADSLAKGGFVSRPTSTLRLTNRKEWMLTENGFDKALKLLNIPRNQKELMPVKSFEVQQIARSLAEAPRPENYSPFEREKKIVRVTRESTLRTRGFRQAVIEAYDYRCAICGMKIASPDSLRWEVEAAHIVPKISMGKDDIWNGIALCRLHHWGFDVGWFSVQDDFMIRISPRVDTLPPDFGKMGDYDFIRILARRGTRLLLPKKRELRPHQNSIRWHRENRFCQKS